MRLIDADKIDFGKVFVGGSDFAKDAREAAQNLINLQPTAYDVDKVVEELEALRQNEIKLLCEHESYTKDRQAMRGHNVLQDAIKIVKSGVLNQGLERIE